MSKNSSNTNNQISNTQLSSSEPIKETNQSTQSNQATNFSWYDYLRIPSFFYGKKTPSDTTKMNSQVNQKIDSKKTTLESNLNDLNQLDGANKFIPDELVTDVTKNINSGINTLSNLKKSLTDPLSVIIISLFSIFVYVYFANDLICQILGLCYPAYHMYTLLQSKNKDYLTIMKPIMKYFVIYTHIEVIAAIFKVFGLIFSHLKFSLIFLIIYMTEYRLDWLDNMCDKIIYYDKIICSILKRIQLEFYKISSEINTEINGKSKVKNK